VGHGLLLVIGHWVLVLGYSLARRWFVAVVALEPIAKTNNQ